MMGDTEVEFITRFHNLEGALVSERKKNFFKLLRDKSLLPNEEQLKIVLKDLRPRTYLESLLRIDMLIYFKKTGELLEILKEGNEVFISKIIKQPWFFKEAFREISANEFVNEFLPCTSFALRMKILKKVSHIQNETQMDELFECVLQRYGLYIAKTIVHNCSSVKILEVLSHNEIHLRPSQVTMLFDKDPDLFKSYLTHYENITGSPYKEKYVFKYIALKNPELLLELNKENKLKTKPLGRRLSKKIINLVKDEVKRDVTTYTSLFKANVIVRSLRGNFKNIYFDLFPRKLQEIHIDNLCNKLLQFYPKNRRWDLFYQTFLRVFDDQIVTDNLGYISIPILNMCSDKEVKQQWAEVQYNKRDDNSFLKYYEPAKLMPLFKEKMNVSSKVYDRASLLNTMMDSCKEYEDLTAFEKVLEYACIRLRNDDRYSRQSVLNNVRHCFPLGDLLENHWKYINELIEIARIKREYNYYHHLVFTTKYLEFLFKNGKPFRTELSQFIKDSIMNYEKFWPQVNNGAIEKEILIQILNIMPDIVHDESKEYKRVYQQLTLDIFNFSLHGCNAVHCIRLVDFPHLMTFIRSILDKTSDFEDIQCQIITNIVRYNRQFPQNTIMIEKARLCEIILTVSINQLKLYFEDLLVFMLMKKNRSELENEMLKLYFEKIIDGYVSHRINFWFLKNEPEILIPFVKKIATTKELPAYTSYMRSRARRHPLSYFKEIKLYSHLNIDMAFIDFLQERISNPNCVEKEDIMNYLSVLLSTDGFIKVVTEYFLPKKIKLDLQDEDMKEVYKSQCHVAKILKDVSEPVKMLPIVMKFCIGDYLQSALCSLYSICYRSPENRLLLYMDILSKRAVSVRKHALFLSCAVLDYDYTINQLKTAEQSNVSSQKHIFSATQKYFLRNQSEDLLDLLISNMGTIDKNDTETLNSLSSIKVPKKFQVLYIEKCWRFFESVRLDVMIEDYLRSLLCKIIGSTDIVASLSSEFCKHIISNYFEQKIDDLLNMEQFVCKVLRFRELEQNENFDFVFKIISSFKADNKLDVITRFFGQFYAVAKSEDFNPNFVNLFSTYWEQCFTCVEMFEEYVLLKLLRIKYDSHHVKNYAENVAAFMDFLISEYGLYVCNRFKLPLKKALASDFAERKDEYLFFYYFLKCNLATTNCIIVINIMDKVREDRMKDSEEYKEICQIYYDILQILSEVEVPIVQVYYKSYVREI